MFWKKPLALLIVILSFHISPCYAQLSQAVSSGAIYSPPSPNAAALLRYANVPVDEYTGVPSVVLPIDQLSGRQLSVPITLSYHGSGNKVQDVASNVGLGFVLNAGGVITRVMRGLPDEAAQGYQYTGKKVYSNTIDSVYLNAAMNSKIDAEPDMFYLNFLGHTGKLVIDTLGNAQYLPDQGFRVISHPIHNNPDSTNNAWVIKDFSGTTYIFGADTSSRELTVVNLAGRPITEAITYVSSWYLSKVISADGKETVNFSYNSGPNLSYKQFRNVTTYAILYNCTDTREGIFSGKIKHTQTLSPINVTNIDLSTVIQVLNAKYLSSIQNDMGSIAFSYGSRLDISGALALNQVKVFTVNDTIPLKTYTFNESYFISPNSTVDTNSMRLRLDCVFLKGTGAETKQLFVFTYNEQTQLPPRNSNEFDHWGYYTTLDNRAGPTPVNLTADKYGNYVDGFDQRQPDSVRVKAWILTKIRNMNGGYTNLFYSINQYKFDNQVSIGGGLRINSIVQNDSLGQVVPLVTQYGYLLDDGTTSGMIYNAKPYYIQGITNYQAGTVVPSLPSLLSYEANTLKKPLVIIGDAAAVALTVAGCTTPVGLVIDVGVIVVVPAVIDAWNFIFHRTHRYHYDSPPFSISSTPLNNLFDINGASVCYSQVEVINGDGSKVFNYYTSQQDYPDSTSTLELNCYAQDVKTIYGNTGGYPPSTSFAFERGLLKRSIAMDNYNNPVSYTANTYQLTKRVSAVSGLRPSITGYAGLTGGALQVITYDVGFYKEISQNIQLVKSTTQLFDQSNRGNSIITSHSYTWQSLYPTLIHSESTPRSDGNILTNYTSYPMEYTPGTTFIDNMVSNYQLALPIESVSTLVRQTSTTESHAGISIIGGMINRYKPGGLGLLDTTFSVRASKPIPLDSFKFSNQLIGVIGGGYQPYQIDKSYIGKAFYQVYDSKNNLIQSQNVGEAPSSVIWGYNQDVPIAKISNATVDKVAYTGFETNDQRYWSFTTAARDSSGQAKTGRIRYQLSGGAVSTTNAVPAGTYILSLWTQGAKPTIAGTTADVSIVSGESDNNSWNFYMDRVSVAGGSPISLTGSGFIDELRLYPQGAHMSTISTTPQVGLSSAASIDDKVNTFQYDSLERIQTERDDEYNILKEFAYSNVPQVLCAITPDTWIGIDSVCYTNLTGIVPDTNRYSATAVNSYGNLICTFTRQSVESTYIGQINFTVSFADSTTYTSSIMINAGDLSTMAGLPLGGRSPESVLSIGIDTIINLSDTYGLGYQRYTNRERVRDGYTEANTLTGGIGPYIAPVQSNTCPALFTNNAQTNFYKNDCTTGNGSYVPFTVPAGIYTASSQFAADSTARLIGQAYANGNGNCTANDTTFIGSSPYCITSTADPGTPSISDYHIVFNNIPQINMLLVILSRTSAESVHDATVTYTMTFNDGSSAAYTTPIYKGQQIIPISPPLAGYGLNNLVSIAVTGVVYSGLNRLAYADRNRMINGVYDGYEEANSAGTYYIAPIPSPGACGGWFYNTAQTGFYKNDCAAGGAPGTPVSYTVAAHTDSSTVSQSYADALARIQGQAYANSAGNCYVGQSIVTTYAGNGTQGIVDGAGNTAQFNQPQFEAIDGLGNIYVADGNYGYGVTSMIRKISTDGTVSTFAGSTTIGYKDSTGTAAQFASISGMAIDALGNVYVADGDNWMIRKITPAGVVTTLAGAVPRDYGYADGQGTAAKFYYIEDIAIDRSGNLYALDNSRLRMITSGGLVSTFGGNGTEGYRDGKLDSAEFNFGGSGHITVDPSGIIYVYDSGRIRKIQNDSVSTLAGDGTTEYYNGTGTSAGLGVVSQMTTDAAGNIYCSDYYYNCIRKITPAGVVTTLNNISNYGYRNGSLTNAAFTALEGIVIDSAGNIYVSDGLNYVIRKITPPF